MFKTFKEEDNHKWVEQDYYVEEYYVEDYYVEDYYVEEYIQ